MHASPTFLILIKDNRLIVTILIHFQKTGHVRAPVAVVGRRPDGDQILLFEPLDVAFLSELVGSGDQLEAVVVVELGDDFVSEEPAGASVARGPVFDFLGVGPH